MTTTETTGLEAIEAVGDEWNLLAERSRSPFLTHQWLRCWWESFGDGEPVVLFVHGPDGALRGGACLRLAPSGELTAPTDLAHGYDWDVVAADEGARREVWAQIARTGARRLRIAPVVDGPATATACDVLRAGGYRVVTGRVEDNPFLRLPGSWDDLLASAGRTMRSNLRRSREKLAKEGEVTVRVARTEEELERDLDVFLKLEASGWKGRAGTAIACDPRTERLYAGFAAAAARAGWLWLSILEVAGTPVAAALLCVFAGRANDLKSGYDERYAAASPGLVLLGENLRRYTEIGIRELDFLGGTNAQKLRWASEVRTRVTVRGYRGASTLPTYAYRRRLRPLLGAARRRVRSLRASEPGA